MEASGEARRKVGRQEGRAVEDTALLGEKVESSAWECRHRWSVGQVDQQLRLREEVSRLGDDVARELAADRSGQAKLDALRDRLGRLGRVGRWSPQEASRRRVAEERPGRGGQAGDEKTEVGREEAVETGRGGGKVATRPRPPRQVRVVSATATTLGLAWEPPILDGGSRIWDYEVRLCGAGHGPVRAERTSRFCLEYPVAHEGYTVRDLLGDTRYCGIRVRCLNAEGWSDWSEHSRECAGRTRPTGSPSRPLFVREATTMTSWSFGIEWSPPLRDGGAAIVDYAIATTEERRLTPAEYAAEGGVFGPPFVATRELEFKTGSVATCYVLEGLRGNATYKNTSVRALNAARLESSPGRLETAVTTSPPSLRQKLQVELARAKQGKEEFIDTAFYQGYVQREPRRAYVDRLQADLDATLEACAAVDEVPVGAAELKRRWREQRRVDDEVSSLVVGARARTTRAPPAESDSSSADDRRCLRNLEFRIGRLETEIGAAERLRWQCHAERAELRRGMAATQARLVAVRAEMDRVARLSSKTVSSSAAHGSSQTYEKAQLQRDLLAEARRCETVIAQSKRSVRELDEKRRLAEQTTRQKSEQVRDRRERRAALLGRCSPRSASSVMERKVVDVWRDYVGRRVAARTKVSSLLRSASLRRARAAWLSWSSAGRDEAARTVATSSSKSDALLAQAAGRRAAMVRDALESLAVLSPVESSLRRLELSSSEVRDWRRSNRGGFEASQLHAFSEGDAYCRAGKFAMALEAYNQPRRTVPEKIRCLEGAARALAAAGAHARALVCLDRSLALCRELEEKAASSSQQQQQQQTRSFVAVSRGRAWLLAGEASTAIGEHEEARVYLERASAVFGDAVGDVRSARRAAELLREAAFRQQGHCAMAPKSGRGSARSSGSSTGLGRLDDLGRRLRSTAADDVVAGGVVALSRDSARALRLRGDVAESLGDVEKLRAASKEQSMVSAKIAGLLELIDKELEAAKRTTEDEMKSALVHDREQVFEVEELKVRLAERRETTAGDLEASRREERAIDLRISNRLNDAEETRKELAVERGELMKTVTKNQLELREIAFDPRGARRVCASAGRSILVFDAKSGELGRVFQGDESGRHAGDVRGHTGTVASLWFARNTAYSGSTDATLMIWDVEETTDLPRLVLRGHRATVTAVCASDDSTNKVVVVASGSADSSARLWCSRSGDCLAVLEGHLKSIVALRFGAEWLVTGGADGQAKLWSCGANEKPRNRRTLRTDSVGLSALEYGSLEVVGGLQDGSVVAWWLASGEASLKCRPHERGPVRALQFDATRLVTCGGGDGLVVVTDLTSGDTLQSLRGHEGPVLAVALEATTIKSAGVDRTLREWLCGTRLANRAGNGTSGGGAATDRRRRAAGDDGLSQGAYHRKRAENLEEQQQRRVDDERKKRLARRSQHRLDKATVAERVARATDATSLDIDVSAERARSSALDSTRDDAYPLGSRLSRAIGDSVDPDGEVARARSEEAERRKKAEEELEMQDAAALADKSLQLRTKAQRELEATAASVREFVVAAVVEDVVESLAREALRSATWRESLAGRLDQSRGKVREAGPRVAAIAPPPRRRSSSTIDRDEARGCSGAPLPAVLSVEEATTQAGEEECSGAPLPAVLSVDGATTQGGEEEGRGESRPAPRRGRRRRRRRRPEQGPDSERGEGFSIGRGRRDASRGGASTT